MREIDCCFCPFWITGGFTAGGSADHWQKFCMLQKEKAIPASLGVLLGSSKQPEKLDAIVAWNWICPGKYSSTLCYKNPNFTLESLVYSFPIIQNPPKRSCYSSKVCMCCWNKTVCVCLCLCVCSNLVCLCFSKLMNWMLNAKWCRNCSLLLPNRKKQVRSLSPLCWFSTLPSVLDLRVIQLARGQLEKVTERYGELMWGY